MVSQLEASFVMPLISTTSQGEKAVVGHKENQNEKELEEAHSWACLNDLLFTHSSTHCVSS